MRQECIDAVSRAIGKPLTQQEVQGIESRLVDAMKSLARQDTDAWRGMSQSERLNAAAQRAAVDLVSGAGKKQQRIALTIISHDKNARALMDAKAEGKTMFHGLSRLMENADAYIKGVSREYFSSLRDTIEAVEPRFFGFMHDTKAIKDFAFEVFGQDSGNALAKGAAKAWLETVENMRVRFNAAGGDIGKLDYAYVPQPSDTMKVRQVGASAWAAQVLPKLDRSRYLSADGSRMGDDQMTEFLHAVHETISTDGLNKLTPGASVGKGMMANRHGDSRQLHFKDAESYLDYMADYGRGNLYTAMQSHVMGLSRDIAMLESFGPNPEQMYRTLHDMALKDHGSERLMGPFAVTSDQMWASLSGKTGQVVHQRLADISQGIRNIQVHAKLGAALLSSANDLYTYFETTGFNRLPLLDSVSNLVRAFGDKDMKDFANRAGLIADSVISDMNRWTESNIGEGWTSKLANATMRASLLDAWTDAIRRGFSVTMMGGLGKISRMDWNTIDAFDHHRMTSKGVTEADWQVWQKAKPEEWRGSLMLTPEAIRSIPDADLASIGGNPEKMRNQAVSRLLGVITDEAEYASIGQDLMTRAALTRGTQKGEVAGEVLRAVALFKGFPMAMISRHWRRAFEMEGNASRTWYAVRAAVGTAVLGAVSLQMKDIIAGKDPRDMGTGKFWGAALAQGGGAGTLGDILYTGLGGQNRAGIPNWMSLAGPVVGSVLEGSDLTFGNVGKAMQDKETHVGEDAFRFARSNVPGAGFLNLWYTKSMLDHLVLQDLQEYLSPGYKDRVKQRAEADWGQQYWWQPGDLSPNREIDFAKAVGE